MSTKPILSKDDITELLETALRTGNKKQVRGLLEQNKLLQHEGNSEYDLVLATHCPYKARLYATLTKVGKHHLKSLQCGGGKMGKKSLLEFVLLQDCESFVATFSSYAPIARLAYQKGVVDINLAMRLFVPNAFNSRKTWDLSSLTAVVNDLESCLNQPLEDWYAKETMPQDFVF